MFPTWNLSFWKNHLFLPVLYLSSKRVLTWDLAVRLPEGSLRDSLLTSSLLRLPSTEYRVGIMWLKLTTLTKVFILLRLATFFLPMLLVTFLGYRSMPATRAWPYILSWPPSLDSLPTTAFLPAMRPAVMMTTLPDLMNLPIFCALFL